MLTAVFAQLLVIVSVGVLTASGHGRLVNPPSRASMWRYGFDNQRDYDDNQGFCGGFHNQWEVNGGKCGICGDPYQGPRTHEPGQDNIYANGIIVRNYQMDQVIEVEIQITAHHKGFFEFRLCPSQDRLGSVTQSCLDRFLLELETGGNRFTLPAPSGRTDNYSVRLRLPSGLRCSHCVLQWHYNTGNSWGCDADGNCDLGLGKQEQFRACADISISGSGAPLPTSSRSPSTTSRVTAPDEEKQEESSTATESTIVVAATATPPPATPPLSLSSSTSPSPQPNSKPTVDTTTTASSTSASIAAIDTTEESSTVAVTTTESTPPSSFAPSSLQPNSTTRAVDTTTTSSTTGALTPSTVPPEESSTVAVAATDTSVPGCACTYRSAGPWAGMASIDSWCVLTCPGPTCDHWNGCERFCPETC